MQRLREHVSPSLTAIARGCSNPARPSQNFELVYSINTGSGIVGSDLTGLTQYLGSSSFSTFKTFVSRHLLEEAKGSSD